MMKTIGYVDRGPRGGLMISESREKHWNNQPVVMREDAERAIAEAVAAEREKNAKTCDDLSGQWIKCRNPKLSDAQYWEGKSNAALDCAEAIWSAAK